MKKPTQKIRQEDKHVGNIIRQRRKSLSLSQSALARRCGVSFQQLQKFENGMEKIGASSLCDIAKALSVQPGYFFSGLGFECPHNALKSLPETTMVSNMRRMSPIAMRALLNISQTIVDTQQSAANEIESIRKQEQFNSECE